MYGSTETQRSVGYFVVTNDLLDRCKEVIYAGEGMKGSQLLVLNSKLRLAGVGEVGEIFVRSHHLARGYVGLEEATSERFLENPFYGSEDAKIPGDRMYK